MARLSVAQDTRSGQPLALDDDSLIGGFAGTKAKNSRSKSIKLPNAPTHTPGEKMEVTDQLRMALASDDDDDDDDEDFDAQDDPNDTDFAPAEPEGKAKKRKSNPNGRTYQKADDVKAEAIIDAVLSLHHRGESGENVKSYVRQSSMNLTDKKIIDLKQAMTRKLTTSTKGFTASATAMLTRLSSLPNDHPDHVLDNQLRDPAVSFEQLSKWKTAHEDDIREIERGLVDMKNQMKLYKFACEVHPSKTVEKRNIISFLRNELVEIENERYNALASSIEMQTLKFYQNR